MLCFCPTFASPKNWEAPFGPPAPLMNGAEALHARPAAFLARLPAAAIGVHDRASRPFAAFDAKPNFRKRRAVNHSIELAIELFIELRSNLTVGAGKFLRRRASNLCSQRKIRQSIMHKTAQAFPPESKLRRQPPGLRAIFSIPRKLMSQSRRTKGVSVGTPSVATRVDCLTDKQALLPRKTIANEPPLHVKWLR